jgi:hypothetical protein
MNVLIVSDEPERKSFDQIISLKNEIQELGRDKVYLFIISNKGIFLNEERIEKRGGIVLRLLERVLNERTYGLIVVSLELNNLKELFPPKGNILDLIKDTSPQTDIFLFGASSILGKLERENTIRVFLYRRLGVSKLTKEFRNDVINYVKTKKSE